MSKLKKRAALNSKRASKSSKSAPIAGTVAADRDLAGNVRAAANLFNQCLALAKRAGLKVIEGIETTSEAGGCPIDAGPVTIVDISRVY